MKQIAVVTTVGSIDDARRLAREIVEQGLAACAQVSEIESFYLWKSVLENEKEYRIVLKTSAARYDEVERAIKAVHPYELPAIYAVPVEHAYAPYAQWVEENSRSTEA